MHLGQRAEAEHGQHGFGHDPAADRLAQEANQLGRDQNGEERHEDRTGSAGAFPDHRTFKGKPARHFDFIGGEKG